MTEILELSCKKQRTSRYSDRYYVTVITELFYYEIVYRFFEDYRPHFTITRMTYGKVHESRSGFTKVLKQDSSIREHAARSVDRSEKRMYW